MADKLYYSIKEVSEMMHVPMATLRFWEGQVAQLHPKTNSGHTRFYTPEDLEVIRRIMYLREQNVPVKDWTKRLNLDDRFLDKRMAAAENLKQIRTQLIELRDLI